MYDVVGTTPNNLMERLALDWTLRYNGEPVGYFFRKEEADEACEALEKKCSQA